MTIESRPGVYIHRVGAAYNRYMNGANEAELAAFADVVSDGPTSAVRSSDDLVARMRGCDAILSLAGGWTDEITAEVLNSVGTIKLICIAHWGGQLVDAAREANITLIEGSNANTLAVAEWTLTAALMGIRKLQYFDRALKSGSPWGEPRREVGLLCESTVGIVGLGRIGSHCARHFGALGANVIAYDPYWTQEGAVKLGVSLVSLDDLLRSSHVISLHLPVTAETTGLLGAREFALVRDRAVFINSSRAALYDEAAFIAELRRRRFSAYVDVFEQEPLPSEHPFRAMENVVITPHIAGDNNAMCLRCGREAIDTLSNYFTRRKCPAGVHPNICLPCKDGL